jgi:hypothetical protein
MVVITDGGFLLDNNREVTTNNNHLHFLWNVIDWLTDVYGIEELKTSNKQCL